jgi:hypothetical protein
MIIRMMTAADIPQIVDIHLTSWSPRELSVKLGAAFVDLFYRSVVQSPNSFGFIAEADGMICGYAVGFSDYPLFNKSLSKVQIAPILLRRALSGKVSVYDGLNLFLDDKKFRRARFHHHHLGALALANAHKSTALGKQAITETIMAVLGELKKRGCAGCSLTCDERNMPLRKYMQKFDFEEIDVIRLFGRQVVLYEKTL